MRLGAGKKGESDPILLLILDPRKHYTLDPNLIWDTFDLLLDVESRAGLLPLHRGHRDSLHFKIDLYCIQILWKCLFLSFYLYLFSIINFNYPSCVVVDHPVILVPEDVLRGQ